jgi:aldehyde:ferredoxin oxidoreductase
MMTIPDGPYAGMEVEEPEYEQLAAWGPQIDNRNVDSAAMLSGFCDRLGFDNNEMGWIIGWLMECYERGLLSRDQLNGLEMNWGNVNAARKMMEMIAYREGIGDLLAEGIMRASKEIGGEAAKAAIYTLKGNAPRGHDHRTRWGEMFDTIVSNTGTLENHVSISGQPPYSSWAGHPEEVSDGEALTKGVMLLNDSLGNCRFPTGLDLPLLTGALNAVTGWDYSEDEAKDVGLRAVNLMKAFNLRAGIGRELDAPSERYGSTPVDGPNEGIGIKPVLEPMLRNYYGLMGWDEETSEPLPETLRNLDLAYVIKDLEHSV